MNRTQFERNLARLLCDHEISKPSAKAKALARLVAAYGHNTARPEEQIVAAFAHGRFVTYGPGTSEATRMQEARAIVDMLKEGIGPYKDTFFGIPIYRAVALDLTIKGEYVLQSYNRKDFEMRQEDLASATVLSNGNA